MPERSSHDQTMPTRSQIGCRRKPIGTRPMSQPCSQVYSHLLEIFSPNLPFRAADANAHLAIDELFFDIFSLMAFSFDFINDLIILKITFENPVL
jgi:hypothetical protein